MNRSVYSIFLTTAIISMTVIFLNLGGIPLLDPDEPVYAETPKEMFIHDEFVSPRIYGEYWYDKPPMYYWLVASAYKIFGISDFSARFPSALLAVICIGVVLHFGMRMFNQRAGMIGALVLVTSIEYFYLGKAAVTDITLTLCLTSSLLCFINKKYYLFYLFAGLATLTKGPIGLFFPVVITLIYLFVTRNLSELKRMKIPAGIVIFSLVAFPWYIAMYHLHGSAFIETFLGFHNVTRFTSPEHPSGVLWYYYFPVLIIGFFPWNAILLQSIYHSFLYGRNKSQELIFLNIWAIVVFLFFSIAQTKLVSYILPMYPALAMIVGWHIDRLWSARFQPKRQYIWGGLTLGLIALFSLGTFMGAKELPGITQSVLFLNVIFIFMFIYTAMFIWRNNIKALLWGNVVAMIAFSIVLSFFLFPSIAPQFSAFSVTKQFEELYDGNSPVYVSKFLRPGFAFYGNRYGEELVFSDQSIPDIETIIQQNKQAYFVVRDIDYERISEKTRNKLICKKIVDNKIILSIR